MHMEFEGWCARAFNDAAVEIDDDDVVERERGAHRSASVDKERVGIAPGAAVAAVVDDGGALEHANRLDQLLFQGVTRRFHNSHERPIVTRFMASARRPSSSSSAAISPPSAAACACTRALISV